MQLHFLGFVWGRGAPRPLIKEGPLPRASYRRGGGRRQETTLRRFAPDVADI